MLISHILTKAYEDIISDRESVSDSSDSMQFCFTKGPAPTLAALIATHAQAENKDHRLPTYMASLNMQKAFDVGQDS